MRHLLWLPALALLVAAGPPSPGAPSGSAATEMHLMASNPQPHQVMSGSGIAFALTFDHPLDHAHSVFVLTGQGHQRVIPLRLTSAPDVLYASVGRLPAGSYVLAWDARAADGGSLSGSIPFDVKP